MDATTAPSPEPDSSTVRLGGWATLGEPRAAVELAACGLDWVCLDGQHGHFDDRSVRETLALRGRGAPILVRVAANDVTLIGRALDAGADGVIVPMVQDAQQAEYAVASAHYQPRGHRSFGPMGGVDYGTPTGLPGRPIVAVMVETRRALDDVDQIAATPDLDMIFVGPFDLSLTLGLNVDDVLRDTADDAPLPRIVAACRRAGILAASFGGDPSRGKLLLQHGFTWVATASDAGLLRIGAAAVRAELGGSGDAPGPA